jgi:endonuclease/exonuclease/phosphatase family metal-dependent hydrolase
VAALSRALPGFSAHYGVATDVDDGRGGRSLFGNLILSRMPVLQVYRHMLPWPADPAVKSMQRIAVEVVLGTPHKSKSDAGLALRVTTTHLEYYSERQRMAQVDALRAIHSEACAHAFAPRTADEPGQPFTPRPRPASAILTGDFNCIPEDAAYQRMTAPFDSATTPALLDAWTLAKREVPRAPTAGVHENSWAKAPFCCDFVFVTADLASRVRNVTVDVNTQASDHQPVLLELDDR